ncbi:LapA family protein [Rhodococcus opacus]|uniref:LapA family protein n=1 Tax=Rhodococcus opacus TaxID=37919 RepID=UPI002954C4F4|nr:LapA family protein [Rhodococcus opacus]MDV7086727.1 LapA family protein [Rhodococcus opacus]
MLPPTDETPNSGPRHPPGGEVPSSDPRAHDAGSGMPPDVARGKGIKHTRTGATWTGLVIGILVLVLLLVFILQNLDSVVLELFVWEFTVPLGVTLLFAAIAGAVIMALVGGVRILQIRRAANRQRKLTT